MSRFNNQPTKRINRENNEVAPPPPPQDDHLEYDDDISNRMPSIFNTRPQRVPRGPYSTDRRYYEDPPPRYYEDDYPPEKRSGFQNKIMILYIILLLFAVAFCITAGVFAFRWIVDNTRTLDMPDGLGVNVIGGNNQDDPVVALRPDMRGTTAMIREISTADGVRTLLLVDTEAVTRRSFNLADNVTISNRMGSAISFSQLRVGQIIDVSYDARFDTPQVTTIRENIDVLHRHSQTNILVNTANSTLSIGAGAPLDFNSQTLVMSRGDIIPIGEILPTDIVSIFSLGNTVWVIHRDSSHGYLRLSDIGDITNGRITIGYMHALYLDEIDAPVLVLEGEHEVIVEGDNIETFTAFITIEHGRTLNFSLRDVEFTAAAVHFVISPANAAIYINGVRITGDSAELEFGEHTVLVEREGYISEERVIQVTEQNNSFIFELEAEPPPPPPPPVMNFGISSTPTNALVFINGELRGSTTLDLLLDPGTYNITLRRYGYLDYNYVLHLQEGQQVFRSFRLIRQS